MRALLTLCLNLVILTISDASAVKLVAGDRNVVKRNGTTHTISKYYVVPNDFDPDNITSSESVEVSRKTTLRMNSNHYSESKASEIEETTKKSEENNDQVIDNDVASNHTLENNKVLVNVTVDSDSSSQEEVQDDDNTSESTKSESEDLNLDLDNMGTHLLVEPLSKPINISSNLTGNIYDLFQSRRLTEDETSSYESKADHDTLMLTNFGIAVHDKSIQNVEDFWKLVRLSLDSTTDERVFTPKIEKLYQLLDIYTILYEAAEEQKPFESMIDSIIDILQTPFTKRRNTHDLASKTYVSGDYDDDCVRKCQQKAFKPQLENLLEVTKDTQEDPGSNQTFSVSSDEDNYLNDVLTTTEPRTEDNYINQPVNNELKKLAIKNLSPDATVMKWVVVDKSPYPRETFQLIVEDKWPNSGETIQLSDKDKSHEPKGTDNQLLINESKITKPLVNVDRSTESFPSDIEALRTGDQPWYLENRSTENLPGFSGGGIKIETDPETNSKEDNGEPIVSKELTPHSAVLAPKALLNPLDSLIPDQHELLLPSKSDVVKIEPTSNNSEDVNHRPNLGPVIHNYPGNTNVADDFEEPVSIHGENPSQHSGYTKTITHSELIIPNNNNNPAAANGEERFQHPGYIPMVPYNSEFTNAVDDYEKPSKVYSQNVPQHSGYTKTTSTHSEFTNTPNDNSPTTDNNEDIDQHPDLGPVIPNYPENTNIADDFEEPALIHGHIPSPPSGYTKTITHSELIIPNNNNNNNPAAANGEERFQHPGYIPMVPYNSEFTNAVDDYEKPTNVYSQNVPQHSGYTKTTSTHSESTNIANDYKSPTIDNNEDIDQHPDLGPVIPNYPENTNIANDFEEPALIHGHIPSPPSGYTKTITHSELIIPNNNNNNPAAANGEERFQHPGYVPMVPYNSEFTNAVDDYEIPSKVYSQNVPQHSGYTKTTSTHSEFTNTPNDNSPTIDNNENIDQRSHLGPVIPNYPENTNIAHDYEEPASIYGENPSQHSGYTKTITHSEFIIPNNNNNNNNPAAANGEERFQHPGYIPMVPYYPEFTNTEDKYKELNPVNDEFVPYHPGHLKVYSDAEQITGNSLQHPGYVAKSHSEVSGTNDYNNPTPGHEHAIYTHPGMIQNVPNSPEYINVQDTYDKLNPVHKDDTVLHPGWQASSHAEYEKSPYDNNYPRPNHEQDISSHPGLVHHVLNTPEIYGEETVQHPGWQYKNHYNNYDENINTRPENTDILNDDIAQSTLVNDEPTENNNYPLTYQHHTNKVHTTKPTYAAYLHGKRLAKLNYLKQMQQKMASTYKLLTLDNLLKLYDAVIKTISISKIDTSDYRALVNLKKIINIILILAEKLNEPDDSNAWYMKIFYNTEKNPHPLQLYVYNLIRQRWLHELMLVLWRKNFDIQILQNPSMFPFLRSWQFPNHVQTFLEPEDDFDFVSMQNSQDSWPEQFSSHTYDDLLEEVPEDLEKYVTNKVIESYKAPNDGIVIVSSNHHSS
ncbi:hypothetical protein PYW08_010289 [Mythimna loreyi]|uniref:Uncharacterized protein n=1 Tax=Mythimna loreyi TaxID=667449 RepID=A0ACC2Q5D7_9NEOP|nr:hypothetical protein PYW08_010289 [Mythimna loreyi]